MKLPTPSEMAVCQIWHKPTRLLQKRATWGANSSFFPGMFCRASTGTKTMQIQANTELPPQSFQGLCQPAPQTGPHLERWSISLGVPRPRLFILLHPVLAFAAALYTRWLNWTSKAPGVSMPQVEPRPSLLLIANCFTIATCTCVVLTACGNFLT
jgi:hypothetical protein